MFNTEEFDLHVNTIKSWIDSCLLVDQLFICRHAVDQLVSNKFRRNVDYFTLESAMTFLEDAISTKHLELASIGQIERLQLLDRYRKQYHSEEPLLP